MVALFLFLYHHPSVDSVDSSPLWEPYLPLLEERWHAVSEWWLLFGVLFLFPYHHPSVDSVDSPPLWEPYLPLLEERWHAVSEWWLLFDVLFSHFNTLRQADMACLIY